jgi:hypothetical protein
MMNFDWIISPLTIYGVLASGGAAALYLVVSTRIEMRRHEKRHLAERHSLREAIAALDAKLEQMCVETKQNTLSPAAFTPFTGLNVHKRTEALRMYRRGNDSHTISAALSMPQAEVVLLEKVHHLLNGGTAA